MRRLGGAGPWSVLVGFEPRDLWVGVYWNRSVCARAVLEVYVCVFPTLVVLLHREVPVW